MPLIHNLEEVLPDKPKAGQLIIRSAYHKGLTEDKTYPYFDYVEKDYGDFYLIIDNNGHKFFIIDAFVEVIS